MYEARERGLVEPHLARACRLPAVIDAGRLAVKIFRCAGRAREKVGRLGCGAALQLQSAAQSGQKIVSLSGECASIAS